MLTSSRKGKGRRLQIFCRNLIYKTFPHLGQDDVVSRSMGAKGVDIILSPIAREACPISFECKNTAKQPTHVNYEQAVSNVYPDTIPVIAWKPYGRKFENTLIMMSVVDLLKLVKENYELRKHLGKQKIKLEYVKTARADVGGWKGEIIDE